MLTSNTPHTPSLLIAAFAIGEKVTADQLLPSMQNVLNELARVNLLKRLVSIVTDGSAVEKKLLNLVKDKYPVQTTTIPAPSDRFEDILIEYSLVGGTKTVTLIDSKHTSKNALNAQSTGARVLVLGDYIVTFAQLLGIVDMDHSPMFKKDVIKRDRQDDQAMERFLSPENIEFVTKHTPQDLGFIVYLFLFGELHSVVQSRFMPNGKRIEILLTVDYFLQGWVQFIAQHPDYGPEHFLPAAFFSILKKLIRGLLGLIYIFRDHGKERPEPFLPWRHTTEPLEHYFGTARRYVKEFDLFQFCQLSKKISTLIDLEMRWKPEAGPARTKEGYQHTHDMCSDLDLAALATYPTDSEIAQISLDVSFSYLRFTRFVIFANLVLTVNCTSSGIQAVHGLALVNRNGR